MKKLSQVFTLLSLCVVLFACSTPTKQAQHATSKSAVKSGSGLSIEFEKYTLENGLDVILHVDRSDPIVAINIAAHVGSGREVSGRTGFAHLFEHLLFLDSENLGYGGLDEMNTRIGGEGTNGFTSNDITQYFQAVPADALEKVIWAEADKLGYFINTVTQPVIDNEKQVVKNEKRQRVDNQPYGHNFYVVSKALYPQDHPYNWQVIGSLDDLEAATLDDVKNFYKRWYVPNNVTLTLSGDFDIAEAKQLVEKYFGEIPRGKDVAPLAKRPGVLTQSKSFYHEDNFATVPQLTLVWPTVEEYHPDSFAISVLSELLSVGKRAPLNEVLVDELKLTSDVSTFLYEKEAAGEFFLQVKASSGVDLDELQPAIEKAFKRFENNGVQQADLDRIKAEIEVEIYNDVQSVLGKAIALSQYNTIADDPNLVNTLVQKLQAVTSNDIERVYQSYIKGKPFIATSFVPKGQLSLALEGSVKASITEEAIVEAAKSDVAFDPSKREFERTASEFDRTKEPPFGSAYVLPQPKVWRGSMSNGMNLIGIENDETPLVAFRMSIDAGRNRGDVEKPAVANLTADLLQKGTQSKTTAELEDAIKSLGSKISLSTGDNKTWIVGQTLARNLDKTVALIEEMLLEPRWDAEEFALLKQRQLNKIDQDEGNPNAIARREQSKLSYPQDHVFSYQPYGTKAALTQVTLEDLKAFHQTNYSPVNATFHVAGDVDSTQVKRSLAQLNKRWSTPAPAAVSLPLPRPVKNAKIYFYDVPEAKQSVVRIRRPSLSAVDPDYPLANAINFMLGGIYTSRLMTELRVNKGYTYGIRSSFNGAKDRGWFSIGSSVRTNVTLEALELIRAEVDNYGPNFTEEDLAVLKGALLRGQALKTETLNSKLSMLVNISEFAYPDDYQFKDANLIDGMTLEQFKAISGEHIKADAMNYLIVGDAETQLQRLEELGLGEPILLRKPASDAE